MASVSCQICLSTCDIDDANMRSLSEADEISSETLGQKFRSLGFIQDFGDELSEDDFSSYLCCWCAIRVADAYDLKLQCLKVQDQLIKNKVSVSSKEHDPDDCFLEQVPPVDKNTAFSPATNCKQATPSTSTLLVSASAHDMFACIRNISLSLRLNSLLMSKATQFLENILSLFTVMISLKEESPTMKKSAIAIRTEVDLWKMKSAMVSDAASFVREVTNSREVHLREGRSEVDLAPSSRMVPKHQAKLESNNKKCPSKFTARTVSTQESKLPPHSSSTTCLTVENSMAMNNETGDKPNVCAHISSIEDAVSVRRSFRSKSLVDHLVYWPSFKKPGSFDVAKQKQSKKFLNLPNENPTEILDTFIKKAEVNSSSDCIHEMDEKLVLVRKRKNSDKNGIFEWKLKFKPKPNSDVLAIPEGNLSIPSVVTETNGEEAKVKETEELEEVEQSEDSSVVSSKTCTICGKILSCNRNLKAHLHLHAGSSPHKCNFCSKVFTSSWNLAQHERVHTGEKPYICNICQMSFRYNVTLRNHKSKHHGNK